MVGHGRDDDVLRREPCEDLVELLKLNRHVGMSLALGSESLE